MEEEVKIKLREEQVRLTQLITTIETLSRSDEWQKIKELLLDGLVEKTKTKIQQEAMKSPIVPENLYRLQGELHWIKKYADLIGFASTLKIELDNIKKRLK